jgi:argininosuccinate synthase
VPVSGVTARVLFAFSGDPSDVRAVQALARDRGLEVATLTLDLGQREDLDAVRAQALDAGAVRAHVIDAREALVSDLLLPALRAGGATDSAVPLARALCAALIARWLTEVADMEDARALAHGSLHDAQSVRFVELVEGLRPGSRARVRAAGTTIDGGDGPVEATHISLLARLRETAPYEPTPESAALFRLTKPPGIAADVPAVVEIGFERGTPVSLNGIRMPLMEMLDSLDTICGAQGFGRFDGVELRPSPALPIREVGEAPAVLALAAAFDALERRVLPAELYDLKQQLAVAFRSLVRQGRWFTPTREAISAFADRALSSATAPVRLELFKGSCRVQA